MGTHEALLVVDMQNHLLAGDQPAHDAAGVIDRTRALVEKARQAGAVVVFVQHEGEDDGPMARGSSGWQFHERLLPTAEEPVIHKRAADSFYRTSLDEHLQARKIERLFVVGCKTEFCIDTTSRRATTLGYDVTLVSDCHTTTSNDVVSAVTIVDHHNKTLAEFGNDDHEIAVVPASAVRFAGER